ncbi:MAG: methionyl-tRNA formyltransferase [Candidatus Helarchaeota archaeon]
MNIIWLSANKFGYDLLKEAIKLKDINISAIITLSKESKTIMYDGIDEKKWEEFGIDIYKIEHIANHKNLFKKLAPDLVIVAGWRQIIPKEILNIPKKGFVGFHPTLIPKGRGPAPIINSIIHGYTNSGITMFYLSEGLDDGDIIGQEKFEILKSDHAFDVYKKETEGGKKLIRKFLPLLAKNKAPRIPQNEKEATFFPKRNLSDNKIDLEKESIEEIYNKIRALSKPYNGAFIEKDGKKLIIWKAELVE